MCRVQGQVTAIAQQPIYIDIIVGTLFQAVGIKIYVNTVNFLRLANTAVSRSSKKSIFFSIFAVLYIIDRKYSASVALTVC